MNCLRAQSGTILESKSRIERFMTYIKREIEKNVLDAASSFPAVILTGARQTGKSTLIKQLFPNAHYLSFDLLSIRNSAKEDPIGFLNDYDGQIILDEVQEAPEILNYVKFKIDENRTPGRYLITGSQQFSLMEGVQESLAGRAAVLELSTFCFAEIKDQIGDSTWSDLVFRGFYPELWMSTHLDPVLWYSSYIKTFIDRDVAKNLREENIFNYSRFIELLSSRVAQEINFSDFSKELGLDIKTIQTWIGFLLRSQIIFLLAPYHKNLGKRVVKRSKLYFFETAIAAHLTKHKDPELIKNGPISGALFENLVVSEVFKKNMNSAYKNNLFYFRENKGLEVDLIVENPSSTKLFEIKSNSTPSKEHIKSLKKMEEIMGTKISSFLLCPNPAFSKLSGVNILDYMDLWKEL